jgi:O-antigen/teichoic acid export membrane protein
MIGPATPVVGFALLTAITLRADVLSLSLWSTKAQTGLYASAVALSEAALSISIIFRTRMQAYLYQEGARRRITRLLVGMLSAGLVGAIVASILAKPIIVTLFGKGFVGAVPMYRVLVFAAVSQMAMDTGQGLLATMGSRRRLLVAAALGAVATIAALIALVPAFGGVGAAYASIIGYGLAGGIAWHSVFQSLSRVTRPADTGVPGNTTLPHSPRHRA